MDPTSLPTDSLRKFITLAAICWAIFAMRTAFNDARKFKVTQFRLQLMTLRLLGEFEELNTRKEYDGANQKDLAIRQRKAEHKSRELGLYQERLRLMMIGGWVSAVIGGLFSAGCWTVALHGLSQWARFSAIQEEMPQYALREKKAKAELAELELINAKRNLAESIKRGLNASDAASHR